MGETSRKLGLAATALVLVSCNGSGSPEGGPWQQVSTGEVFSCGLDDDGNVECWGLHDDGMCDAAPGTFARLDAGYFHACALSPDGTAACWGDNTETATLQNCG